MRQQLLAWSMEQARELGADVVRVLRVAPAQNTDLGRVTAPALRSLGHTVSEVWQRLLRQPDRFHSLATEQLVAALPIQDFPELAGWWRYLTARYAWLARPAG